MVHIASNKLISAQGSFELLRYPRRRNEPLQAWCAADELLLESFSEFNATQSHAKPSVLVANDEHGALCVALEPSALWTDSALAALAVSANCELNRRAQPALVWSTQAPPAHDVAILRIPKQLPYFEYQLNQLAKQMRPGATLLCAGMDKHLSPKTASLIERHFGQAKRQPGKRKARVFSAVRNQSPAPPLASEARYFCAPLSSELISLANVFSREQLDIGSRFLLDNLSQLAPVHTATDLACGNGVIGLTALQRQLCTELTLCDESAMAIESARQNVARAAPNTKAVNFHHGDGLLGLTNKAELILCNPPFHLGHTVDDFAGRRLLEQCANHLTDSGQLVLVANRHLEYQQTLKRHFHRVDKLAQNNKFVIWVARK